MKKTLVTRRETLRERRRMHNDAVIVARAGGAGPGGGVLEVRCECTLPGCRETCPLPLEDYEAVRRRGEEYFLVAPEHAPADPIVLYADRWFVVAHRSLEAAAMRERARRQRATALALRRRSLETGARSRELAAWMGDAAVRIGERSAYWRALRDSRPGQVG